MSLHSSEHPIQYECIPNFSCCQTDEVFPSLRLAAEAAGVRVLDMHSDRFYNRTVLTFLGSPSEAKCAAFKLVDLTTRFIDMTCHRGVHPRLGATDIIPFVPIPYSAMSNCIEDVRELAKRIAEELELCVYLYGEAALRSERRRLNQIRRGEFENWFRQIEKDPNREPDFGKAVARRCGPVILGVRPILVAINFVLRGADLELARAIAKRIRHVNRGLPSVQSSGFLVGVLPHVSCNILDYTQSSPRRVFEEINLLCREAGAAVLETEIVGMIPRAAMSPQDREKMHVTEWHDSKYLDLCL